MTERDIEGNVLALVGAIMEGQEASAMMHDPAKRDAAQKKDEEAKIAALKAVTNLVVTLLCDIHRIADALEAQNKPVDLALGVSGNG